MGNLVDETGKQYKYLTVIERAGKNSIGCATWLCRCSCGHETIAAGSELRRGHIQSCGCLRKRNVGRPPLPKGEAAFNQLYRQYTRNAKTRGYKFNLSKPEFRELTQQPCHYCGALPSNSYNHPHTNGAYTYSGLDRMDNDKGYTLDNVVPCCIVCNYIKLDASYDEFLAWIKQVYLHLSLDKKYDN